ncbi:melatonin receptor type 1A-like [Actinia tenebrosa]|uniref:Melatonin receptor type 1A-like n=1 Tax=Actinia tenebrosa TaxID=6105 RepID=A0A6P8HNI2_ACTTE|nr:melatonin receptor type 1A-like [Actinia tenebrosa]
MNGTESRLTSRSTAIIAAETSILLLIGLITFVGNLLVVISIYRNPSLRTITNYFVLSLCVTDILAPLLGLTPILAWSIRNHFFEVFGEGTCIFQGLLTTGLTYISVITITLMAVNRFIRVCKPDKYSKLFNKKTSLIMIGALWTTVFTLELVALYGRKENKFAFVKFLEHKLTCGLMFNRDQKSSRTIGTLTLIFILLVPFIIIFFCYFKVFKKIRQHKRSIAPASNPRSLGTSVQEIKVTRTLFAVLIGYCFTWIPVMIVTLLSNLFGSRSLPRQAHMIVTFSGISSSAINPVIYGILNRTFRHEYQRIVCLK